MADTSSHQHEHQLPLAKDPVYQFLDILIPLLQIYGFYLLIIGGALWYLWPKLNTLGGLRVGTEDPQVAEQKRREAWLKRQGEIERLNAERKREREELEAARREVERALREAAEQATATATTTSEAPVSLPATTSVSLSSISSGPSNADLVNQASSSSNSSQTVATAASPKKAPADAVRESWAKKAASLLAAEDANGSDAAKVGQKEEEELGTGKDNVVGTVTSEPGPAPPSPAPARDATPVGAATPSEPAVSPSQPSPPSPSPPSAPAHQPALISPTTTGRSTSQPSDPYADRPPPPIYFSCPPEAGLVESTLFGSQSSRNPDISEPFRILWTPGAFRQAHSSFHQPTLFKIIVFGGLYIDGLEFHFRDFDIVRIGNTSGDPAAQIEIRHGDYLRRVFVRSGEWVDGFSFILSGGRELSWVGGSGGEFHEVEPGMGTRIVGFHGFAGPQGVDGIGVIWAPVTIRES